MRSEILADLANKTAERQELVTQLEKYRECDPEVLEQVKQKTKVAMEAANRWTGWTVACFIHFVLFLTTTIRRIIKEGHF